MTESGVIPPPEERGSVPPEVGRMMDIDGVPVIFRVNLDGTVRIRIKDRSVHRIDEVVDFDVAKADEFTRLWFATLAEAERQAQADMPP